MNKTSEKQIKWAKEWKKKNPERVRYYRYKGNAKTFVRHWATEEDFKELEKIFKENTQEKYQKVLEEEMKNDEDK